MQRSRRRSPPSRKSRLLDLPSSCVYDALGINSRTAPFRSIVAIIAHTSGCFHKLFTPQVVFSQNKPLDMTDVHYWLHRRGQFDLDAFANCMTMLSADRLPFPLDVGHGWAFCWRRLLERYKVLYAADGNADPPIVELVFAIYQTSEEWKYRAKIMSPPDEMEEEEDAVHAAGHQLLIDMGDSDDLLVEMAAKAHVKRRKVLRRVWSAHGGHFAYQIVAKPDGMFRVNGIPIVSDAKRCKSIEDDSILQAMVFSYMYNTRFAFVVCRSADSAPCIFAVDSECLHIREYREHYLLGAFDQMVAALCGPDIKSFLAQYFRPSAIVAREQVLLNTLQLCQPTDLGELGAAFQKNSQLRAEQFDEWKIKLRSAAAPACMKPTPVAVKIGEWTTLENLDCFHGHVAHSMLLPETDGIDICRRVCETQGYGGFCIYNRVVYFRAAPSHLCVQWACFKQGATFHAAPIDEARARLLPSHLLDRQSLVPLAAGASETGDGASETGDGASETGDDAVGTAAARDDDCAAANKVAGEFEGPYRNTVCLGFATGETALGYATFEEAKAAAACNESARAITLTSGHRYTLRSSSQLNVSSCWEQTWVKSQPRTGDSGSHAQLQTRTLNVWDSTSFHDPYARLQGMLLRHLAFFVTGTVDV